MIIPVLEMRYPKLGKRDYNDWACDPWQDCSDPWNNWGRWVALVLIILTFFFFFFLFAYLSYRRRRRLNQHAGPGNSWYAPNAWFGPKPHGTNPNQNPNQWAYDPYTNTLQPPPAPPYSPPAQGYYQYPQPQQFELQNPYNQGGSSAAVPLNTGLHGQSGPQETGQEATLGPRSPPPAHISDNPKH